MKKKLTEITLTDIKSFMDGNWRYILYTYAPSVLTKYVKQKFNRRLIKGQECLLNGSCLHCGCSTPEVFMADKACGAGCYPAMKPLSKRLEIQTKWQIRKMKKSFPILNKSGIKI